MTVDCGKAGKHTASLRVRASCSCARGFPHALKIAPGVRITLSKRGASVSGGPKGAKMSVNTRNEKRASVGRFGTFWRKKL